MFCGVCGNKLEDNARFCTVCGEKIDADQHRTMSPMTNGYINGTNEVEAKKEESFRQSDSGFILPPVGVTPGMEYTVLGTAPKDVSPFKQGDFYGNGGMYSNSGAVVGGDPFYNDRFAPEGMQGSIHSEVNQGAVTAFQPTPVAYNPGAKWQSAKKNSSQSDGDKKDKADKKKKKWILPTCISAAVLAVAAVVLFVINPFGIGAGASININDYISFASSGYEGYGVATISIDSRRIRKEVEEKFNVSKEVKKLMKDYSQDATDVLVNSYLEYSLEPSVNLSNGSQVQLKWKIDKDKIRENFGIEIACDDKQFVAEGLEDVGTLDPFAGATLVYKGMSGKGTVSINWNKNENPAVDYMAYTFDKSKDLSNGDVITLTADIAVTETRFISKFGAIPAERTRTYVVDGLGEPLYSVDGMDMGRLIDAGKSAIDDSINLSWSFTTERYDGCTYLGYMYEMPTADSDEGENAIILFYRVDAGNEDQDSFSFFTYATIKNVVKYPDGSLGAEEDAYGSIITETNKNVIYIPEDTRRFYYWGYTTHDAAVAAAIDEMPSGMDYVIG